MPLHAITERTEETSAEKTEPWLCKRCRRGVHFRESTTPFNSSSSSALAWYRSSDRHHGCITTKWTHQRIAAEWA